MDNIFELESGVIMCKLQLALHDPKKALFYFDMYNFSIKVPIKLYPCLYYNLEAWQILYLDAICSKTIHLYINGWAESL